MSLVDIERSSEAGARLIRDVEALVARVFEPVAAVASQLSGNNARWFGGYQLEAAAAAAAAVPDGGSFIYGDNVMQKRAGMLGWTSHTSVGPTGLDNGFSASFAYRGAGGFGDSRMSLFEHLQRMPSQNLLGRGVNGDGSALGVGGGMGVGGGGLVGAGIAGSSGGGPGGMAFGDNDSGSGNGGRPGGAGPLGGGLLSGQGVPGPAGGSSGIGLESNIQRFHPGSMPHQARNALQCARTLFYYRELSLRMLEPADVGLLSSRRTPRVQGIDSIPLLDSAEFKFEPDGPSWKHDSPGKERFVICQDSISVTREPSLRAYPLYHVVLLRCKPHATAQTIEDSSSKTLPDSAEFKSEPHCPQRYAAWCTCCWLRSPQHVELG